MNAPGAAFPPREARFVAVIAVAAALRVLVFAAAFPFFTNVDEHRHVDMSIKYARGYLPHPAQEVYEPVMGKLLADHGSPEYATPPGRTVLPPTWRTSAADRARRIAMNEQLFGRARNLEAFQSPVYYATAGVVLALGRGLGLEWGPALYGVRALNALALAALVWIAYALLRRTHPESRLVRTGVPVLLAVLPLDALFYVTGDALSPLMGGLAFAAVVSCTAYPTTPRSGFAAAGFATAIAVLTKATNVVVLGLCGVGTLWALRAPHRDCARLGRLAALWLALALPLGVWGLRSHSLTGSALGTAGKVAGLGWGVRPLRDWWGHPLLTPSGFLDFLAGLVPIFWRGEIVWQRTVLAWAPADVFYTASTALLLGLAIAGLRRGGRGSARLVEGASALAVVGAVAVLMLLSLHFVFSDSTNPTADRPYFTQGRLVSGVWLPFAILYVRGIECATRPLAEGLRPLAGGSALALVALVCLASELWLSWPAFASPYNFYHLP